MKKFLLLSFLLSLVVNSVQAVTWQNFVGNRYYDNGYYTPNVRYSNGNYYQSRPYYYNRNYYPRPSRYNGYYPQNQIYYNIPYMGDYYSKPVIYRSNVNRKSAVNNSEKLVANQFSGIEKLENQIMLQTYEYDSAKNRIERLEQRLFGAVQEGDLAERFETLKLASKNFKAYNPKLQNYSSQNSYRPPVFTGGSGGGWKNTLLGNFKNQFAGMPTGITPAMDPAYMDYFEAERAMMGNGEGTALQTNRGYYYSNRNRGAGTGVTILD